jgi:hypothetical protein
MKTMILAVLVTLTGCASAQEAAQAPQAPQAPAQWETRTLANGVELRINPEAGPEAVRVAEMIQSEMRSRYIGAR